MAPTADDFVTVSEAARVLGLPDSTVRNWVDRGKVPSFQRGASNRRFVRLEQVRALAELKPGAPPPRYQG